MFMNTVGGKNKLLFERETFKLNGIAYRVHNLLGRFAREKQYCDCYEQELIREKVPYVREVTVGDTGNRLDFVVYNQIPLEMKAKPFILKDDYYQMQRYLQVLSADLGLIYNFRDRFIKPKRILKLTKKYPQSSVDPDTIRKSESEQI
jgi:GxxExxY protein